MKSVTPADMRFRFNPDGSYTTEQLVITTHTDDDTGKIVARQEEWAPVAEADLVARVGQAAAVVLDANRKLEAQIAAEREEAAKLLAEAMAERERLARAAMAMRQALAMIHAADAEWSTRLTPLIESALGFGETKAPAAPPAS